MFRQRGALLLYRLNLPPAWHVLLSTRGHPAAGAQQICRLYLQQFTEETVGAPSEPWLMLRLEVFQPLNAGRAAAFHEINRLRLFGLPASGVHDECAGGAPSNGQGYCAHRRTLHGGGISCSKACLTLARLRPRSIAAASPRARVSTDLPRWGSILWWTPAGRREIKNESSKNCPFPKDDVFARFLKLIKNNPDKKIFVHCRLGNDRTGMMIAAYRMGEQGWSAEQAMKEMHFFGYTSVHHLMCPGLAGDEKSFPDRLKESPAFRELR